MSFRTVIFVTVMLGTSSVKAYEPEPCERQILHNCDTRFVDEFRGTPQYNPDMGIYCDVFQHFANCMSSSSRCKGEFIDSQRYIVLQCMTMDKTLDFCPQHDLQALKEIVHADSKYRLHIENLSGIAKDDYAECTAKIHRKCAKQMAQAMENGVKMCSSIRGFIQCYKDPRVFCPDKIYGDFVDLMKKFAPQVLNMYKESPGVMPDC